MLEQWGIKEMGWLQFSLLFQSQKTHGKLCCSLWCTKEALARGSNGWDCSVGTLQDSTGCHHREEVRFRWPAVSVSSQEHRVVLAWRCREDKLAGWCWTEPRTEGRPQVVEIWEPVWVEMCRAVSNSWIFLWDSGMAETAWAAWALLPVERVVVMGHLHGQQGIHSREGRVRHLMYCWERRKGLQTRGRRDWEKGYRDETVV